MAPPLQPLLFFDQPAAEPLSRRSAWRLAGACFLVVFGITAVGAATPQRLHLPPNVIPTPAAQSIVVPKLHAGLRNSHTHSSESTPSVVEITEDTSVTNSRRFQKFFDMVTCPAFLLAALMVVGGASGNSKGSQAPSFIRNTLRPALLCTLCAALGLMVATPALAQASASVPSATLPLLQQIAAVLAPIFTIGLYAAPMEVLLAIVKAKDVGSYALLPYQTMQLNCGAWVLYALRLADPSILLPNAIGVAVSTTTFGVYGVCSNPGTRGIVFGRLLLNVALLGVLAALKLPLNNLGLVASFMAVCLFASPLAQLGTVIKTRDSSSLPFTQILMGFLTCVSWTVYGLFTGNPYVIVPNALGGGLSLLQLGVIHKYRKA